MNDARKNRLYDLLPPIYRMRDAEQGKVLEALLQVISEQVNLVEDDLGQLYDNWFIETCQEWIVPYLGDLVGYTPARPTGLPTTSDSPAEQGRHPLLIPRREVANTIRNRRRKGTLALLEMLASDVAAWPSRTVEAFRLLGFTQALNHQRPDWGRTIDVRLGETLDLLNTAFTRTAHTVDVRRINSVSSAGRYNLPTIVLFVWRLQSYSVTETPAYYQEATSSMAGSHCYSFSILANDTPLYMLPEPETDPTHIADEFNLPVPIRRRLLAEQKERLYGPQKSLQIWRGVKQGDSVVREVIPAQQIVVADLNHWSYAPHPRTVAVDPVLGRIAFPERQWPEHGVWVRYHYGFSMGLGGGEYERILSQPDGAKLYRVGRKETFKTINAALSQWHSDSHGQPVTHAVIEINDSGVYVEPLAIVFKPGQQSLQLRAANRRRPVIRLLDWQTELPDSLSITGAEDCRFTLDGLLVTGRSVHVSGELAELKVRHTTLVPGWSLGRDCSPQRATGASLEITSPRICVIIEHSILGSIQVDPTLEFPIEGKGNGKAAAHGIHTPQEIVKEARCQGIGHGVRLDPIAICLSDSIVDATDPDQEAVGSPGCPVAHAMLTIVRCTIFGRIQTHAVRLGENTIFNGIMSVARRQIGCLRFCYVPPGSRTPRRYHCLPDLVVQAVTAEMLNDNPARPLTAAFKAQLTNAQEQEARRVVPRFNSLRYGQPAYCQLSSLAAEEISGGADDESEMGVFHNLYQPQRSANLKVRLDENIPAEMEVGVIFSS